ncbi:MAG TPA: trehalose-phosphatase [Oleiagrimonas sp.]|nr:trehalose-phosphatase [Oleiagrimonas sp.]
MSAARENTRRPLPPLPEPRSSWALFLDVDGTLAGFRDDPDDVRVPASLKATLAALHAVSGGAVALVSGRHLRDLDRLLGPPLVAASGLHGLQRRRADGSRDDIAPASDQADILHRHVDALAARMPRLGVEDKGVCMTLHYRATPALEQAVTDAARAISDQLDGYETQPGNCSIDIKPAGIDKGRAVTAFADESPFAGRTPVYVGDDLTDEHAFAAVNVRAGISIRVGDREPTQARFGLRDPRAVEAWLLDVLKHLRT